jgi:hypothetical protein
MSKQGRTGMQRCDFDAVTMAIRFRRVRLRLCETECDGKHSGCCHAHWMDGLCVAKS